MSKISQKRMRKSSLKQAKKGKLGFRTPRAFLSQQLRKIKKLKLRKK